MSFKLTNEQKIYELSLIWSEAKYNFAFWDYHGYALKWDEEYKKALTKVLKTKTLYDYYKELQRFTTLLNDGHTYVTMPKSIYLSEKYSSLLPIYMAYIEDKIVIINCTKKAMNKVKLFSVVKKIDGIPVMEYIEKKIFPYIWHAKFDSAFDEINYNLRAGANNSKVKLELEYDGNIYEVSLKRDNYNSDWIFKPKPRRFFDVKYQDIKRGFDLYITTDDVAIIIINNFKTDNLCYELYKNYNELKKAKGFIIDVSENIGGNSENAQGVAALFIGNKFPAYNWSMSINKSTYMAWSVEREIYKLNYKEIKETFLNYEFVEELHRTHRHVNFEHKITEVTEKAPGVLEGPIVVLSTEKTASAAEDFLNMMRYNTKAKIIGRPSFGSTGIPLRYELKSGGTVRICSRHSFLLDGNEFTNKGIIPDIHVDNTIESIKNGRFILFEKAYEEIKRMINNGGKQ